MRLTLHCCECAAHTQLALSLKYTSPCWILVMDGITQSWPTALQMRAKRAAGAPTDPKQQRAPCRHLFIFVLIVMWLLPSLFLQRWFIGLRSNHGQQCDWTASVDHCLGEHTLNKLRPRMALTDWMESIYQVEHFDYMMYALPCPCVGHISQILRNACSFKISSTDCLKSQFLHINTERTHRGTQYSQMLRNLASSEPEWERCLALPRKRVASSHLPQHKIETAWRRCWVTRWRAGDKKTPQDNKICFCKPCMWA